MNNVNKNSQNHSVCYLPNPGFMMREIAGEVLLVSVGENTKSFNGMITFSETGAFIWKHLDGQRSVKDVADLLARECNVPVDEILPDVEAFLTRSYEKGLVLKR